MPQVNGYHRPEHTQPVTTGQVPDSGSPNELLDQHPTSKNVSSFNLVLNGSDGQPIIQARALADKKKYVNVAEFAQKLLAQYPQVFGPALNVSGRGYRTEDIQKLYFALMDSLKENGQLEKDRHRFLFFKYGKDYKAGIKGGQLLNIDVNDVLKRIGGKPVQAGTLDPRAATTAAAETATTAAPGRVDPESSAAMPGNQYEVKSGQGYGDLLGDMITRLAKSDPATASKLLEKATALTDVLKEYLAQTGQIQDKNAPLAPGKYNIDPKAFLELVEGQGASSTAETAATSQPATTQGQDPYTFTYKVQPGDNALSIADRLNTYLSNEHPEVAKKLENIDFKKIGKAVGEYLAETKQSITPGSEITIDAKEVLKKLGITVDEASQQPTTSAAGNTTALNSGDVFEYTAQGKAPEEEIKSIFSDLTKKFPKLFDSADGLSQDEILSAIGEYLVRTGKVSENGEGFEKGKKIAINAIDVFEIAAIDELKRNQAAGAQPGQQPQSTGQTGNTNSAGNEGDNGSNNNGTTGNTNGSTSAGTGKPHKGRRNRNHGQHQPGANGTNGSNGTNGTTTNPAPGSAGTSASDELTIDYGDEDYKGEDHIYGAGRARPWNNNGHFHGTVKLNNNFDVGERMKQLNDIDAKIPKVLGTGIVTSVGQSIRNLWNDEHSSAKFAERYKNLGKNLGAAMADARAWADAAKANPDAIIDEKTKKTAKDMFREASNKVVVTLQNMHNEVSDYNRQNDVTTGQSIELAAALAAAATVAATGGAAAPLLVATATGGAVGLAEDVTNGRQFKGNNAARGLEEGVFYGGVASGLRGLANFAGIGRGATARVLASQAAAQAEGQAIGQTEGQVANQATQPGRLARGWKYVKDGVKNTKDRIVNGYRNWRGKGTPKQTVDLDAAGEPRLVNQPLNPNTTGIPQAPPKPPLSATPAEPGQTVTFNEAGDPVYVKTAPTVPARPAVPTSPAQPQPPITQPVVPANQTNMVRPSSIPSRNPGVQITNGRVRIQTSPPQP